MSTNSTGPRDVVRRFFAAFQAQDRQLPEELLHEGFRFSSPRDNRISRAEYFERCWPHSDKLRNFAIEHLMEADGDVLVLYRAERVADSVAFRNTEHIRVEGGRIKEVDVYFGRELKD